MRAWQGPHLQAQWHMECDDAMKAYKDKGVFTPAEFIARQRTKRMSREEAEDEFFDFL